MAFQVSMRPFRCRPGGAAYAARTRARARARARVGSSVLSRIDQSPCCPGNSSGPLSVADWVARLKCVGQVSARRRGVRRAYDVRAGGEVCTVQNRKLAMLPWALKLPLAAPHWVSKFTCTCFRCRPGGAAYAARARVGGEFCIAQTRTVAMMPWNLKWPLSGGRLDLQVSMRLSDVGQAAQRALHARARSRVGSLVLRRLGVSPIWSGNSSGPVAVADWKSKSTRVFLNVFRCRPGGAANAARSTRARVGSSVLRRIEKSPCCPGK